MTERGRVAADLDSALIRLDLDGLRFVLCVALLRGMDANELERVVEQLRLSPREACRLEATAMAKTCGVVAHPPCGDECELPVPHRRVDVADCLQEVRFSSSLQRDLAACVRLVDEPAGDINSATFMLENSCDGVWLARGVVNGETKIAGACSVGAALRKLLRELRGKGTR